MKKFLVLIVSAIALTILFVAPACASDYSGPNTPPIEGNLDTSDYYKIAYDFNDYYAFLNGNWLDGHSDFLNTNCTNDYHATDCIHRRLWNLIISSSNERRSLESLNAALTSGDWARRGITRLLEILPQAYNWALENYTFHDDVLDGWTELRLRNFQTGEVIECVMHAYTNKPLADDDGYRNFVFTWSHQDVAELSSYDSSQLITSLNQSKDVATAEFTSWLITKNQQIVPGTTYG